MPRAPKGAYRNVRVFANAWFTDVAGKRLPTGGHLRDGAFRAKVPLRVGANSLTVKVKFETYDDDAEKFTVLGRTAATVTMTRKRSVDTGTLDRATAAMVSEDGAVYRLCGESEDCGTQIWCFSVSEHRVDCPVGVWEYPSFVRECAFVATVRVHRRRVRNGRYGCRGRVNPDPSRHIVRGASPDCAASAAGRAG